MHRHDRQSGQVMIIVAVWLVALIGSAALILLAGSVEWQRNQLQQLADQAALDAALKIGVSCDNAKASTVITEADNFLATQRTRTGALNIGVNWGQARSAGQNVSWGLICTANCGTVAAMWDAWTAHCVDAGCSMAFPFGNTDWPVQAPPASWTKGSNA